MKQILIPVSPGELIDKITVLEIKAERIADESKLVEHLGVAFPIPVEVVPFGLGPGRRGLEALGATVTLRGSESQPFVTDNGNYILDARFAEAADDPADRERAINAVVGIVDCGLFIGMAESVIIGTADGAEMRAKGGGA